MNHRQSDTVVENNQTRNDDEKTPATNKLITNGRLRNHTTETINVHLEIFNEIAMLKDWHIMITIVSKCQICNFFCLH